MSPKSKPFEVFEEINQVVLDGISDNMAALVQCGNCGSINRSDTTANGYNVINFISEAYMLQNNTTICRQIIPAGELVFKAQYV